MFKVLVIAYYFPPMGLSGVQRVLKFTKYMSKNNWHPTVITSGDVGYFAHDEYMQKEAENSDIRIIRTSGNDPNRLLSKYGTITMPAEIIRKTFSNLSKTFFIPDNKVSWSKQAYLTAKELLSKEHFDILFVTIPPYSAFSMAAKLKEEFNIPLIVDYRDLWFGNQFSFYPTFYHKLKHKKMEYNALKAADKIVTINRYIKEKLLVNYKFLTFDDISIVPQGYDPDDFEKATPIPLNKTKLKLTYSGIFYTKATPKFLLKAFKLLLKQRPDIAAGIELHFCGLLRKENEKLIKKLGIQEFVKIHGYLNHKEALDYVLSSDVLWMMIGRMKAAETISTGKLFEYFGTKKPILGCVPEGAARLELQRYKASFICEPDDIEGIKEQLINIYTLFKAGNLPVCNEDFVEKHNRITLTEELTRIFQFTMRADI